MPSIPLFILYTSGSTGKPKGVQHSSGGYLLQAVMSMKWTFDIKPDDVFWCTGRHRLGYRSYLHHLRPAGLRCDRDRVRGRADLPGRRPFLEDDPGPQGIDLLHRPDRDPFADQGCRQQRAVHPKQYDLSSLRILGSVGEPINPVPGVVLRERRRRSLPDRRYLLADRDRCVT